MKPTITLGLVCGLVVSSLTVPARAADPDPWIAKDKALHASVSAVIASGTYAVSAAFLEARGHALLLAGGVTLAVGAGKELLDLAGYGDPSWRDFAADVVGTIVGLAVAWGVDLMVRGVDDQRPLFVAPHPAHASSTSSRLTMPGPGLVFSF